MIDLDQLTARVTARLAGIGPGRRVMIGITGSPASGKSTLAQLLLDRLAHQLGPELVAYVPMDGFHLADGELDRLRLRGRKGAPATFDALGYVALLRRLRENTDAVVYAPGFERTLEQPIAGSIPVFQSAPVVITEGNYLLLGGRWSGVRPMLDEIWFVRVDDDVRLDRLMARHLRFGKSPGAAECWIQETDQPNSDLIEATMGAADLVLDLD
jgi:pantothenate kinase